MSKSISRTEQRRLWHVEQETLRSLQRMPYEQCFGKWQAEWFAGTTSVTTRQYFQQNGWSKKEFIIEYNKRGLPAAPNRKWNQK